MGRGLRVPVLPNSTSASPLCTATPSAPRSIEARINGSVAVLEWSEPLESGGRDDVAYNILCSECLERQPCRLCTRLVYAPRARGLVDRTVTIEGLQPYITYSFQIQAINGVSDMSHNPPQVESINITTNKDGKLSLQRGSALAGLVQVPVSAVCITGQGLARPSPLGSRTGSLLRGNTMG